MSTKDLQAVINEAVETASKAYNEIREVKEQASYFGKYDESLTRLTSLDLLTVATTAMEYAAMLLDKDTLEFEGFLVPKIDRMMIQLANSKTRIKQAK
jgi:hypothetical protein